MGLPGLRSRRVVPQRTPPNSTRWPLRVHWLPPALAAVREAAVPGVSTLALDEIAEAVIRDGGGTRRSSATMAFRPASARRSMIV